MHKFSKPSEPADDIGYQEDMPQKCKLLFYGNKKKSSNFSRKIEST
jgi:hypothetical protein